MQDRIRSESRGFSRKSLAPRALARAARATSSVPLITTTGMAGETCRHLARSSNPEGGPGISQRIIAAAKSLA